MEAAFSPVCTVLIFKADRLYAEFLREHTLRAFPRAHVTFATSVADTRALLAKGPIDLLVTDLGTSPEGDVCDLLVHRPKIAERARRVFVITAQREYRELAALRALAVDGVFDSGTEAQEQLVPALRAVANGVRYWSPSVVEHMRRSGSGPNALHCLLTAFEQVVLSVIGDGCDDAVAARHIGVSPATVGTVRRELHRKLRVQHRGELVRVAAQQGFVRFIPGGVVRPGFAMLVAAYHPRKPRLAPAPLRGLQMA